MMKLLLSILAVLMASLSAMAEGGAGSGVSLPAPPATPLYLIPVGHTSP